MYSEFLKIIADNSAVAAVDDIKPESIFNKDLQMNSMDVINMTIDLENFFKIKMKEKDLKNITTVADMKAYVEKLLKRELA